MSDDQVLIVHAALSDRDVDGRVRLGRVGGDRWRAGAPVLIVDVSPGLSNRVSASNAQGHGVLEWSEGDGWLARLASITVEG